MKAIQIVSNKSFGETMAEALEFAKNFPNAKFGSYKRVAGEITLTIVV